MKAKRFLIITVISITVILGLTAATVFYLDPLFHYRGPREGYYYDLLESNERLQNDGILKNLDYDAVITGSSMCQNFMASEADALFDVKSVKTCFSGGTLRETADNLKNAFYYNPGIRCVIRGIDQAMIISDKDALNYDPSQYPKFTGRSNRLNDISYLLNKTVLYGYVIAMINNRINGVPGGVKSFDEYENFTSDAAETDGFGYEALVRLYGRPEYNGPGEELKLTDEDIRMIRENTEQNITSLARENPDTVFYLFITPYSIFKWMDYSQEGNINRMIDAEKIMTEEILKYDNIRLYSFNDDPDIVCDLDNYSDKLHYREEINSLILRYMKDGRGLLTKDNYLDRMEKERSFFNSYDYRSIK